MWSSGPASNGLSANSTKYHGLSSPAFGRTSRTQANAPRKGGVTKEARISTRSNRFPGRSVRDTNQLIGAAAITHKAPTVQEVHNVLAKGLRKAGSTTSCR